MASKDASSQEGSPRELGLTCYTRSGRPVRKRGSTEDSPYVDSTTHISDEDDSDASENSTSSIVRAQKQKRKRSPSPSPLPEEPHASEPDERVSVYAATTNEAIAISQPVTGPIATGFQLHFKNLTINLPPGHNGPLLLSIDLRSQTVVPRIAADAEALTHSQAPPKKSPQPQSKKQKTTEPRKGFLDLPAELRNWVYELVFVTRDAFNFDSPSNFSRSAAFLRTCTDVHNEGRDFLYSQNHFLLIRKTQRFGSYWEREWHEVGFKAVREFLQLIGPTNISLIRNVTLLLEDATPSLNSSTLTPDDRRFVHDEVLISCLKMLAQNEKLERLQLHFRGRKRVGSTDHRFLEKLTAIKANHVAFIRTPPNTSYPIGDSKQEQAVADRCLREMVRQPPNTS